MTSKEALELLEIILLNHSSMLVVNDKRFEYFNVIKERLEVLEKENIELKELQELNKQGLWNLKQENEKLKNEKEELSQAYDLLNKTLHIVIDCITNATELNQLKIDIMNKILKEVLGE